MAQRITQVDSFTDRRFAGNPAAVCVLSEPADPRWMQDLAAEMNLSETAFAIRRDGEATFNLRWFTPNSEVDLCGHATLAGAHVLWETGRLAPTESARFHTRSGLLTVERGRDSMTMDFPAKAPTRCSEYDDLATVLGVSAKYIGKNGSDLLVEVESEPVLRGIRPDFPRLAEYRARGVIVTARAERQPYDFVSRFFAPRAGVPEDPVTGSAHCCLGPYWSERLGKRDLVGYQASARGGFVRISVRDERVHLGGNAVTVLTGEFRG
jgi:PhzF family phenazine biosynthesis protein